MFGFLIGTVCLIGLAKMALNHRHHGRCSGAFVPSYRPHRGSWWDERRCSHDVSRGDRDEGAGVAYSSGGGRAIRRAFLRWLFERLDTSPGQEKVVESAIDEARRSVGDARDELDKSRGDVTEILRSASFDAEALGAVFARQNAAVEAFQKGMAGALGRVHEALDERQRKVLADIIDRHATAAFSPPCGPYRT